MEQSEKDAVSSKGEEMKESLKYLALISQVGLTILFTVSFFTILGVYLDRWLNTKAIFTLLFVLIGCFGAIWLVVRLILGTLPQDSERK